MITQTTLRTILKTIFQVDEKYIVPKQGNWWNPQDSLSSGTWIAYIVRNSSPTSTSFMQNGTAPVAGVGSEIPTVYTLSDIELQIVGKDAEMLANSIQLWLTRPDIVDLFDTYHAQLCADGLGDWTTSTFTQEGLNSNVAFNTRFRVQWANMINISGTQLDTVNMTGTLTIGA